MSRLLLVTGGTGFLGRSIVEDLVRSGRWPAKDVRLLVRPTSICDWAREMGCDLVVGDVRDPASLEGFVERDAILLHCAGYVGTNQELLWRVNVLGTQYVVDVAVRRGVSRFVHMSSIAVISGNTELPLREDMPLKASMPYGQSKLEAEVIVRGAIKRGLSGVILRPAMVYGPGEPHLLGRLCSFLRRFKVLLGRMDNPWHLCGISTLNEVIYSALIRDDVLGRTFNVADEEVLTAREIFLAIAGTMGVELREVPEGLVRIFSLLPYLGKVVRFLKKARVYDTSGMRSIGFRQKVPVREGLKEAVLSLMQTPARR